MRILLTSLLFTVSICSADTRPNVVLIMCDDMGFSDIGPYGGEVVTPQLDKLAAQGIRFRQFYNNSKCEHTRASLLTGHWWHHVGASPSVHYKGETLGERMRAAGYRTLMVGKWHAGQTPYERGFDRYYGLADGCCNFWNPGHARPGEPEPAKKKVRRWAIDGSEFNPYTPEDKAYYTTDAFTDHALNYLEEYRNEDKPFFLYVAYTAPHYPLHASEEDVAKYRGRYGKIGWDRLREERFTRQQTLGVLMPETRLSPRDPGLPAWEEIKKADRDWWDLRMATYAAMIDRMDRNIGRLLAKLDELGETENTVIFFFSDNGACEESSDRSTVKGSMPWEVTSYLTQGRVWANASNTPFRQYKTTKYEGGIRTPLIACWPGKTPGGQWTNSVGHLIDLTPTLLDLAGKGIPDSLPGQSLVPVLKGESFERRWPLFWQFASSSAMRDHDWKIVRKGKQVPWELYNLSQDPTELNDLAAQEQERTREMARQWQNWWQHPGEVE